MHTQSIATVPLHAHISGEESSHEDDRVIQLWTQAVDSRRVLSELPTEYEDNYLDCELAETLHYFLKKDESTGSTFTDTTAWGVGSSSDSDETQIEESEELTALSKKLKFQEDVGDFLGKNPKFRVAYSTIIERLKNDLIGRATLASGYLNPSSYSEPPTHQSLVKKAAKFPLKFFTTGSVYTVTAASGLIGTACGITAVAASGISCGGSLALELIPIALGIITPVVTTAIQLGGGISEKISDEMHDLIFNRINNSNAKERARTVAQTGSITHHDQLNMELAFGFVFLWQKQLEMLTERDVITFARTWVDLYLKFIQKNKKALSDMIYSHSGFSFLLEDILWSDFPKVAFTNIFNSNNWEKCWLGADDALQHRLSSHLSKNFTPRALILKTGIRYRKNDRWFYWSNDPLVSSAKNNREYTHMINDHRLTRAWLYGYRTFYTETHAREFISLHSNHYLVYDFAAIRLIPEALTQLPAHVSKRGGNKIRKKEGTSYVIVSDHLEKEKRTLALVPAVQRFLPSEGYSKKSKTKLLHCFEDEVAQPANAIDEALSGYLRLITHRELFPHLSKHQEQLEIQIRHLVKNKTSSELENLRTFINNHSSELEKLKLATPSLRRQLTAQLMEICLGARMQLPNLEKVLNDLDQANQEKRKSPLNELLEQMNEEGRLLIPCTIANGYDWMLYELMIKKSNSAYDVILNRRVIAGLSQADEEKMENLEKKLIKAMKKNATLTNANFQIKKDLLTELSADALNEIRKSYPDGPLSSGIFVAEYVRCQIICDLFPARVENKKTVTKMSQEHRRLLRYYHRLEYKLPQIEHYKDLCGLIAEEEAIFWKEDPHPIGPPIVTRVEAKTVAKKVKNLIF